MWPGGGATVAAPRRVVVQPRLAGAGVGAE
jgi:hypothetical protein